MNEYVLTYVSIHIYLIHLSNNPNKKRKEKRKRYTRCSFKSNITDSRAINVLLLVNISR